MLPFKASWRFFRRQSDDQLSAVVKVGGAEFKIMINTGATASFNLEKLTGTLGIAGNKNSVEGSRKVPVI